LKSEFFVMLLFLQNQAIGLIYADDGAATKQHTAVLNGFVASFSMN